MHKIKERVAESAIKQAEESVKLMILSEKVDSMDSKIDGLVEKMDLTRELLIEMRESFKFFKKIVVPILVALFVSVLVYQLGIKG